MAEPKKKSSQSRTRRRRHQLKNAKVGYIFCQKCHEPKLRHYVCKNCGTYRGEKVIDLDIKEEAPTTVPDSK